MDPNNVIHVESLHRKYGRKEALQGLDLTVRRGQCHGLFGRNGAGKTTALRCLLHHLRPDRGTVRVFGFDPAEHEVAVKARLGYVPDQAAFYPWMTVRGTLDYMASFRTHWNRDLEHELLEVRFDLDERTRVSELSKGMRAKLALICALCPEPELLLLDEPTSGLDPVVRREFIETVIGTYQAADPGQRTVLVSTHLINEFEGMIDAFTIIDKGRQVVAMEVEEAQQQFKKIELYFDAEAPVFPGVEVLHEERQGREVQLVVRDFGPRLEQQLRAEKPADMKVRDLSLEEIFVATTRGGN